MLRVCATMLVLLLTVPAFADDPICGFAVRHECEPAAAQCHRDVELAQEPSAVRDANHLVCDARLTACVERMRKPAAECAQLAADFAAILRAMDNPPRKEGITD